MFSSFRRLPSRSGYEYMNAGHHGTNSLFRHAGRQLPSRSGYHGHHGTNNLFVTLETQPVTFMRL
jgi:hypothetical protein